MNWFNLKDLEKRLAENNVSDKEGFYFLLANWIVFGSFSFAAVTEQYGNPGVMVMLLAIPVISLVIGFKANQKGDGKDFLKRFISLHFVIGIRIIVFIILLALPVGLLGSFISNVMIRQFLFGGFIATAGIIYYWYLARSIKNISSTKL
jgi:hypothetical protein